MGRSGANSSVSVTSAKSALQLAGVGILLDVLFDAFAADFFFAFEEHANIDGQLAAAGLEQRLEGLQLHPELAFVVHRAARVDVLLRSVGSHGGVVPLVQRLGGLDIVVRIAQRGRLAGGVQPVGVNQRMALGGDDLDILKADALQVVGHHLGGLADIVFVLFGGADAGNAKQIFQLVDKALLIFAGVGNSRGNGGRCHGSTPS